MAKKLKIGEVPPGRFGVYAGGAGGALVLVGHVGGRATSITARRFGAIGAKLDKVKGRTAWIGKCNGRK